jgi:hypothetical protein
MCIVFWEDISLECLSCSTYIYFTENVRTTLVDLPIYVGSVPTEHLDTFDEKLKESLMRIVKEGIDMDRMLMVINRDERQVCNFLVFHGRCPWLMLP